MGTWSAITVLGETLLPAVEAFISILLLIPVEDDLDSIALIALILWLLLLLLRLLLLLLMDGGPSVPRRLRIFNRTPDIPSELLS